MPAPKTRPKLALALCLVIVLAFAATAAGQVVGVRATRIANTPGANASSDNTALSGDHFTGRLLAYDSSASNLVAGDTNGVRDVFLFTRGAGMGNLSGSLSRTSVGRGGAQANGDSTRPSIDGQRGRAPHCVTFQSTAMNLDSADRSRDSDVFLRDIRRRTTVLVSVGHAGRNGVVDGACEFVTYEAGGKVFVRDLRSRRTHSIARGSNPDQNTNGKGVAYERGGQIYHQRFQKVFNRGNPVVKKLGRELLVSAGARGRGNGASSDPSADDNGFYVAFESVATNLCISTCQGVSDDRNGAVTDVFRRTTSSRAPTRDRMQMASYSGLADSQGNGPSNNPSISGAGENILFDSAATNLCQSLGIQSIDPNGAVRDIYYWNFPRERRKGAVSRESKAGPKGEFNGASFNPANSNRANYIGFTSAQSGQAGEGNGGGIADVFIRFMGGSNEGGVE